MTDQHVPKLRQRFLEDMRIKGLQPKTQTMYLRAMRDFTRFLGHSPVSASSSLQMNRKLASNGYYPTCKSLDRSLLISAEN